MNPLPGADDLIFHPVGKISRIHQAICETMERMAFLGIGDGLSDELAARPAGVDDSVALHFQPFLKKDRLGDCVRARRCLR